VVCRYINTREKGGGEEEKKKRKEKKERTSFYSLISSPRDLAAGQSKGKKITNTRTRRAVIAAEESTRSSISIVDLDRPRASSRASSKARFGTLF